MEEYIKQTQGLLGLVQASITEEEMANSTEAGTKIWDMMREITAEHNLNVQEMLNAILACNLTVFEAANEQLEQQKKEMGLA